MASALGHRGSSVVLLHSNTSEGRARIPGDVWQGERINWDRRCPAQFQQAATIGTSGQPQQNPFYRLPTDHLKWHAGDIDGLHILSIRMLCSLLRIYFLQYPFHLALLRFFHYRQCHHHHHYNQPPTVLSGWVYYI